MKSSLRVRHRGTVSEIVSLDADASAKIRKVLRLGVGDHLSIVDDLGASYLTEVLSLDRASVTVRVIEIEKALEPRGELLVALAVIKGKRMDSAIEKLAEIGVAAVVPLITKRTVVQDLGEEKIDRWRRIATSAMLQSGHQTELAIEEPIALEELLARPGRIAMLDAAAEVGIESADAGIVTLLIGPEGGWDDGERAVLAGRVEQFSLGNSTLRSETAAIVAAYVLLRIISNK